MRRFPILPGRLPLALAVALLSACGTPPPTPPPESEPAPWAHERIVETRHGIVTLFDPRDLAHHVHDPDDWPRQGFAFADDIATGRFAAVLTGRDGRHRVRVTSTPLDTRELAAAGPRATQRLRVLDRRLLLAGGGDAWPSLSAPHRPPPADPRWIGVPDGDYEVTITALDTARDPALPDIVFRLREVESIDSVAYAPGMPELVVGSGPAVAGTDRSMLRYTERCGAVGRKAAWSPVLDASLPLPGRSIVMRVPEALHEERHALQSAALPADEPVIVSRGSSIGTLGVQFTPRRWLEPRREQGLYRELFEVEGRADCAVRITGLDGLGDAMTLVVEPVPMPRDRLAPGIVHALVDRFEAFVAVANDPAWRYKSGRVRHAPDDTSRVLAVMDLLRLEPAETETLLPMNNEERARWLLARMDRPI